MLWYSAFSKASDPYYERQLWGCDRACFHLHDVVVHF